ncbi:MAG: hypothetical protein GWP05_03765 [Anaerolineaceae bacterium]|nr:hypothetical protein [Anaerolineaceae bacterium]
MHRTLLVIVTVVLALAIGAVGLVVYDRLGSGNGAGQRQAQAPQPNEPRQQEQPQVDPAPTVSVEETKPASPGPAAETTAETAGEMIVEEEPEEPAPEETKERVRQLLATLTPEERKELGRQLMRERRRRYRQRRRYGLPSQMTVNSLRWQRDANLKLTGLQQEQIKNVLEPMKPRIKSLLADNWAREDELRRQMGDLFRQNRRDEVPPLNEELQTLRRNTNEIKKQFDEEFKLQLQDILTPEQNEWLKKRSPNVHYLNR